MDTTCQASYPLNSENASPFGTFAVYLSCAEMAEPPTKASTPVITGIVSIFLHFIACTSFTDFIEVYRPCLLNFRLDDGHEVTIRATELISLALDCVRITGHMDPALRLTRFARHRAECD